MSEDTTRNRARMDPACVSVLDHFACEIMNTGKRLIDAQAREQELFDLYSQRRTAESLEEWKAARLVVDELAKKYLESTQRFQEEAQVRSPFQQTHDLETA